MAYADALMDAYYSCACDRIAVIFHTLEQRTKITRIVSEPLDLRVYYRYLYVF